MQIYEFTDCEGCQVEIVSLREKLLTLERRVDIVDWRLGQKRKIPRKPSSGKQLPYLQKRFVTAFQGADTGDVLRIGSDCSLQSKAVNIGRPESGDGRQGGC